LYRALPGALLRELREVPDALVSALRVLEVVLLGLETLGCSQMPNHLEGLLKGCLAEWVTEQVVALMVVVASVASEQVPEKGSLVLVAVAWAASEQACQLPVPTMMGVSLEVVVVVVACVAFGYAPSAIACVCWA